MSSPTAAAALAHVYLQQPGASFEPQLPAPSADDLAGAASNAPNGTVFYDDANRLVVVADLSSSLARSTLRCAPVPPSLGDGTTAAATTAQRTPAPFEVIIAPGPVLSVRVYLDVERSRVAVQRSHVEVEIVRRGVALNPVGGGGGVGFAHKLKRPGERILAFFWSSAPKVDFVVVTSLGVEQHQLTDGSQDGVAGLRLVSEKKKSSSPVSWCVYTHDTRLALLASGPDNTILTGYQFAASGLVKLPRFKLPAAWTGGASRGGKDQGGSATRSPLSSPSKLAGGGGEEGAGSVQTVLRREDVSLLTMYGRVFLTHVDRSRDELVLYRFYRDAMTRQYTVPLYSSERLGLSVVDNALLVHAVDASVVMVFDILGGRFEASGDTGDADGGAVGGIGDGRRGELQLIAAPLPLTEGALQPPPSSPNAPTSVNLDSTDGFRPYGPGWMFAGADIVVDAVAGKAWRLRLDLRAIAESSSDRIALAAFLQRRSQAPWRGIRSFGFRTSSPGLPVSFQPPSDESDSQRPPPLPPPPPPNFSPNALSVALMITMLREREPLGRLASVFSVLVKGYHEASKRAVDRRRARGQTSGAMSAATSPSLHPTSPAVSPSQAHDEVFAPLVAQLGTEALDIASDVETCGIDEAFTTRHADSSEETKTELAYIRAAVVEYLLAAEREGLRRVNESDESGQVSVAAMGIAKLERLAAETTAAIGESHALAMWSPLLLPPNISATLGGTIAVGGDAVGSSSVPDTAFLTAASLFRSVAAGSRGAGDVAHDSAAVLAGDLERRGGVSAHDAVVRALLAQGRLLSALRYVRRREVTSVPPAAFLDAALAEGSPVVYAAVFRFCLEQVPDFKATANFASYAQLLDQSQGDGFGASTQGGSGETMAVET